MSLLPSRVTPRIHTMLLTKQSPKASPLQDCAKTTQHGNSGTHSAHGCTPPHDLQDIRDKIPFLQIFAHKVRTGVLAANNKPIHKRSVEQYLRSMGQIFAAVGAPGSMGAIDFRLGRRLATYTQEDPSPRKNTPPPRLHPPLLGLCRQKRLPQRPRYRIPCLDRFLLSTPTRGILRPRYRYRHLLS